MNQEKPNMIQAALIGGVFLGVSSALPIIEWVNCACCILVIGGGILASFIYLRDYPDATYGDGALLGLLTGMIGGLVWTLVEIPLAYFQIRFGLNMDDLAEIEELLNDPDIPPIVQELTKSILEGGALSLGIIIIVLVTHLLVAAIFACIGGIIGVAIFRPKAPLKMQTPVLPSTPPPMPPPPQSPSPSNDDQGILR